MPANKEVMRATLKNVRKQLTAEFRHQASLAVCRKIRTLEDYRHAKHIALYICANGEIDLSSLWQTAPLHGKFCYFPKVKADKTLVFLPATLKTEFNKNQYNILEPDVDESRAINPCDLDIVFFPLVAFDSDCNRLGMGAGYYDRTFENVSSVHMLGTAYEFQHQAAVPVQPWDIALDGIVTEKHFYREKL